MYNYELRPRLTHLTLTGQDENGLEFTGNDSQWLKVTVMEEKLSGVE